MRPFHVFQIDPAIGHVKRHRIIETRWVYFIALASATGVLCGLLINPRLSAISLIGGLTPAVRKLWSRAKQRRGYRQPVGELPPSIETSSRHLFPCLTDGAARGDVIIDVSAAVGDETFGRRIRFGMAEYIDDITRLNLYGYHDSDYGSLTDPVAYDRKLRRNRALCEKNPYSFAALVDADNPDVYLGFTSVLPLTDRGYLHYVTSPGVPDNEISPDMVARKGTSFKYALVFAIANFKLYRREYPIACFKKGTSALEPHCSDMQTVLDLTNMLSFQLGVLLADGGCDGEIHLLGQSKIGSVQRCFARFGMIETGTIVTADEEPVFSCTLVTRNVREAQAILSERLRSPGS